ncbi:MAG: MFS transporter [Comamonas sp.]
MGGSMHKYVNAAVVYPLAFAQLILWGTIYFSFTLFISPMSGELGWSSSSIVSAFAISLAVSGFMSVPIGRWIDVHGGFWPISVGTIFSTLAMIWWSRVDSYCEFVFIWVVMGVAMAAVLSQPVYAVFVYMFAEGGRKAVAMSSLATALSGSIFLPMGYQLMEYIDWRQILLIFAALNFICFLIHVKVIPRSRVDVIVDGERRSEADRSLKRVWSVLGDGNFWCILTSFSTNAAIATVLAVHLLPVLEMSGFQVGYVVVMMALMGPIQIGVRFFMSRLELGRFDYILMGWVVMGAQAVALLALTFGVVGRGWIGILLFMLLHGVASGALVIVRAAVTTDVFGNENYAIIQGFMQIPVMVARAVAPLAAAFVIEINGYVWLVWGIVITSFISLVSMLMVKRVG